MSDTPTITQQYAFTVGEEGDTDVGIEPSEESVETSLEAFGADVDHRERDTRLDQPEASSFGVDDRPEVTSTEAGEQGALFADTDDDQQTLTGERATSQCLFGDDTTTDEPDDPTEAMTDDPTNADADTTEVPARAVADGGQLATDEDPDDHEERTDDREDPHAERTDDEIVTDDGRVEDPDDDEDDEDDTNDAGFAVGTRVVDRDADDPNPAVVVALPDEPAYARDIDALDGASVADVNPEYGASGPVATVAYADDLDAALDVWREADPDALTRICAHHEVRTYDFPTARLRDAPMTDGGRESNADEADTGRNGDQDTTFDPDEETVTDAWEGAFLSASWGYNQTNVELAQIVEVSGSGKTVLARRVGAERVDHGRTSERLRPTADQYGDEFRLHVRDGIKGEPRFRGSYPLGNDGDMDGPTRRESFYPFDNDPENSIRQTAPNHGR